MLLKHNIDQALRGAVRTGDLASIDEIIAKKSSLPDFPQNLNIKNKLGETPLHIAVDASQLDAVKRLIEAGVDVSSQNNHGNTPLHVALISYLYITQSRDSFSFPVIKLLIDNKTNVNALNKNNEAPLHFAAKLEDSQPLLLLIEAKAFLNPQNMDRETPMHKAAMDGRSKNIRALLEAGADPDLVTEHYGSPLTPLGLAAHFGNFDAALALVQGGAKFEEADVLIAHPGIRPQMKALFEKLKLESVLIEDRPEDDQAPGSALAL